MSKRVSLAAVAVILLLAIVAGATYAAFTSRQEITSVVEIGSVKVELNKFEVPSAEIVPGFPVDSKVAVKNVGNADAYVRVSFVPTWAGGTAADIECDVQGTGWRRVESESKVYYYYQSSVAKSAVTSDLIGKVTVNGDATGNEIVGKDMKFDVKVEAIQAENITQNFSDSKNVWPSGEIIVNSK